MPLLFYSLRGEGMPDPPARPPFLARSPNPLCRRACNPEFSSGSVFICPATILDCKRADSVSPSHPPLTSHRVSIPSPWHQRRRLVFPSPVVQLEISRNISIESRPPTSSDASAPHPLTLREKRLNHGSYIYACIALKIIDPRPRPPRRPSDRKSVV